MRAVYRHSRGYPRLINTICENALISAFARQTKVVSAEIIEEVATDLRLDAAPVAPSLTPMTTAVNEQLQQAEKTLRQLQAALQDARSAESAVAIKDVADLKPGVMKQ